MASVFHVIEHSIPGQHIRESPKGTKHRQEDILQICVKQYVPASTPEIDTGTGLTIIGVPGNGFPKVIADSSLLSEVSALASAYFSSKNVLIIGAGDL